MSLIGLIMISAQDLIATETIFGAAATTVRDTLLGAGAGIGVVAISYLTRNLPPMRRLNVELGSVLGQPGSIAIAVLAVTSAVGEELLFRGALQPLIGMWPTVIIFGVIHGGGRKRLRAWTVFALLAGALLGWLTEYTGNLLAPVLCHLTINYWNLHALVVEDQAPSE